VHKGKWLAGRIIKWPGRGVTFGDEEAVAARGDPGEKFHWATNGKAQGKTIRGTATTRTVRSSERLTRGEREKNMKIRKKS